MGCRLGVDGAPGRDGCRPVEPQCSRPGSNPAGQRGHPIPGGGSRSASYPVDDVHQARMTDGVEGWGMTFGEDKKTDRLMTRKRSL